MPRKVRSGGVHWQDVLEGKGLGARVRSGRHGTGQVGQSVESQPMKAQLQSQGKMLYQAWPNFAFPVSFLFFSLHRKLKHPGAEIRLDVRVLRDTVMIVELK